MAKGFKMGGTNEAKPKDIQFVANANYDWTTTCEDGSNPTTNYSFLHPNITLQSRRSAYLYTYLTSPLIDFTKFQQVTISGSWNSVADKNDSAAVYGKIEILDEQGVPIRGLFSRSVTYNTTTTISVTADISQYQGKFRIRFGCFSWNPNSASFNLSDCSLKVVQ